MLKKKVLILILSVSLICPLSLIANAYDVSSITAGVAVSTQILNSSSKIETIVTDTIELENKVNGFDIPVIFEDTGTSTHLGLMTAGIVFTFPEAKYIKGQSYNLTFTLGGSQSNNDTLVVIPHKEYFSSSLLGLALSPLWYSVGDTVPQWSSVLNKVNVAVGKDDSNHQPIVYEQFKLYNNSKMSVNFALPSNYIENVEAPTTLEILESYDNRVTIWVVMRTNYRGTTININDITLTPIGATKQLFSDIEYKENVQEGITELQEGIQGVQEGIDGLHEQIEQENQQIEDTGSNSPDALQGVIENKGPGFFEAMGSLITSLSYNGTEAKWKMPAIYIPEIKGVIARKELLFEQDIDFGFWVEKIPTSILSIIRALFTIALIIYCFKELYDTVQYVLTLKGGG